MSARRSPGRRRGRAEARPKNENLKKISHELRQHVLQLLDKKPVVERQVDRLTSKNDHLCKELVVIAKLSEQLENELLLNTTDKELEEAKTQIRHQQNNIKKLEHSVKTLKSVILQTENEIRQGRSPSRLDTFIKTLEEDRDYYKSKTENLLRVFRSTSSSPKRSSTLGSMSKKKSHIQAQEEFTQLHQEVIKCTRTPRSTVVAQAMLSHVETERDTALSDLRRMAMECDSLREQLKISQETAFNEKAHLQQRIEELETTIQNLDSERLEQMSRMTLMKEHVDSLETEVKILARRSQDTENELSHQKDEYISLSLMKEKTEQILSEAQQSLTKKKYEIQLNEEKIRLLDEKIDDFSKQCFAQEEKICALKDTILQLDKEKETLQECVEEGREKIVTLEESLKIKEKTISELKILIFDMERTIQKSAEALCFCEKDITSLRQQLQETNKELAQANNNREILAQEKDRLQEHLSNAKQENQVLHVKITNYQNELDEMRQKAQDSNTEIARLKGVLNFKERENSELLENYHKACEQGESWEAKCHQVEADCNSVRLALISVESDNRRLKEKMKTLETEMEQHLTTEEAYQSQLATLHKSIEKMEGELQNIHQERVSILANLKSTQELCIKLDAGKELLSQQLTSTSEKVERLQSECASSHSEIEMLRIQLGNERASLKNLESLLASNREREFQSQIAEQEKDSEIQLLKEQLSLAENKLAVKSRDFTQLKNTTAQLESELGITRRQLATERFERERAVQELRCQNRTVTYQLSSTLRTLSPERTFHPLPHWSLDSSLEGNSSFKDF
ncbi:testis-specific gene 10 protein isoform X2 [Coturnix japonica]|uniref:testis-specific gene 10 protein isoform X2 n=1 Tax=Coturnix japonica TaxID=93934 RepID=UPI000777827F|nr:testis-specific gene 10 protein isoform X2 [Coturnix japonica]